MESYKFLEDSLNDTLNAVTFARLKIILTSIIYAKDFGYLLYCSIIKQK